MKTTDNRHYKAAEGCLIVRKSDGAIMGDSIDLGSADSIENYEESEFPQEIIDEYTDFDVDGEIHHDPTDAELLANAKRAKISEISEYDRSSAVNSFRIDGQQMWLTREERTQIDESINAYDGMGATSMTKYFGGIPFTFTLVQWKQMLNALIVYASDALNVTEAHKAAVMAMATIEEVEAFDITAGYPEKLNFGN